LLDNPFPGDGQTNSLSEAKKRELIASIRNIPAQDVVIGGVDVNNRKIDSN